tara:strand:+ start:40047 stop:41174 length:1128 start_codon:yes stop_codon:yes gene_type:complete
MKITSVSVWTVIVPTIPGRVHSPEYVASTDWDMIPKHIIRLNTNTEYNGIGESWRGLSISEIREGAKLLIGKNPETLILQDIYNFFKDPENKLEKLDPIGLGPAYDTYEMAVLDLVGHVRKLPVHALLGGAVRNRIRADYWMGHQTPADGQKAVERALKNGFTGVKIKCRLEEPMYDRLEAMREVAGPDFKVTVDPNERFYTAEQAINLAEQLEPLGNIEVFEDPIPKTDIEGYEQIHQSIPFPLAMHLGDGPGVMRALQADAGKGVVDCVNLGGSIFGFQQSAATAASAGLPCWHGSGNDLGIAETAYIHAAAAAPNCTMASDFVGSWTREDDLIVEPIQFTNGSVTTPMKPGLGCLIDYDAIENYCQSFEELK